MLVSGYRVASAPHIDPQEHLLEDDDILHSDQGCEHSPTCLSCPLPSCKYDVSPVTERDRQREARDGEILLLLSGDHSAGDVANKFGITERTVYRIAARNRKDT